MCTLAGAGFGWVKVNFGWRDIESAKGTLDWSHTDAIVDMANTEGLDILARIDASVFVLDCLPNLRAEAISERAAPFVRRLRALRPDTPILLVEDRSYANDVWRASVREMQLALGQGLCPARTVKTWDCA